MPMAVISIARNLFSLSSRHKFSRTINQLLCTKRHQIISPLFFCRSVTGRAHSNSTQFLSRNNSHSVSHHRNNKSSSNGKKNTPLPLVIYQTASSYVYISSCALDDDPSSSIHPNQLFTQTSIPPISFRSSTFEFVHPKTFNYDLPNVSIPEVAFLGRSNVGKSSLINAITKKKHLARISKRPGRTQQVNYFALIPHQNSSTLKDNTSSADIAEKTKTTPIGYLIDLPGYGYAKAPEKNVDEWQKATQSFLLNRLEAGNLMRLYFLIDSRRGMGSVDKAVMGWMDEAGLEYTCVLTKEDCMGRAHVVKFANEMALRHHSQHHMGRNEGNQGPFIHVTSGVKGRGIVELMCAIEVDFCAYNADRVDEVAWSCKDYLKTEEGIPLTK